MSITIELNNLFEDDTDEKEKFQTLLEKRNDSELENALQKIIYAAMSEYKQMFLGRGIPSRADEIQQYRLFYLIENYFGEMPSEEQVSSMFKMTQTRSRSLIRSVTTKFHYDLEEIIKNSLKDIVKKAKKSEDDDNIYHLIIHSNSSVEQLNRIIAKEAPHLDQMKRINNSRTYGVSGSSCEKLCERFGIDFNDLPIEDE